MAYWRVDNSHGKNDGLEIGLSPVGGIEFPFLKKVMGFLELKLGIGDVVRLRKQHPCGGFEWEVTRLGADIGLRCLTCGRRGLLARSKGEQRIKTVVSTKQVASDR